MLTINGIRVTPREAQIHAVLTDQPQDPWKIGELAGIRKTYVGETASRHLHSLAVKGLAQKHGKRTNPSWSLPVLEF